MTQTMLARGSAWRQQAERQLCLHAYGTKRRQTLVYDLRVEIQLGDTVHQLGHLVILTPCDQAPPLPLVKGRPVLPSPLQ